MNIRKIRQKLIEHVIRKRSADGRHPPTLTFLEIIHHERQSPAQWHYEAKKLKGKSHCVYIIYDPEDHAIAVQISTFLIEKKFRVSFDLEPRPVQFLPCLKIQVLTHNPRYGKTKQEFLALNGPLIAQAKDVIYLLTERSCRSTFTFHELTLAEWFEKPIVTAYIENVWTNMRSSIRALLGKNCSFSLHVQSSCLTSGLSFRGFHSSAAIRKSRHLAYVSSSSVALLRGNTGICTEVEANSATAGQYRRLETTFTTEDFAPRRRQ